MNDYPGLILAENENRLLASIHPVASPPPLDVDALRALLADAGYAHWFQTAEALPQLCEAYNAGSTLIDQPVAERRDAVCNVEVSPDAMQAWINVVPARGGKPLDVDAVLLSLDASGVSFGVDQAAVHAACAASTQDQPGAARIVVASGQPAQNGEDARFELLVADVRDRSPQVDANGFIDFRDLGAIPSVAAEQPLMRRIPATTGSVGRTVRLDVIEPVPGRDEPFAANLVGAHVAADDGNLLRATFSGQPVRCNNGVNVEQVLRFRNINMATGNVSFDGTVNIDDEVLPGMKVHATGDIVVGGVVDGAELSAGGDIRVAGGIIAKAHVRAGGAVSARFVENSQVFAGTTIAINDTALQSDLQADNQIIVGVKSPQRGRLAGGSARATMLIRTPVLGSKTGGVTQLLIGVNPVLDARYQQLLKDIDKLREDESKLEKVVKHLSTHGDKTGMLDRAKSSWQQALQAWVKHLPEKEALERELALTAGARVEIGTAVEGAVDLCFGKKLVRLRREYATGSFSNDGEHVVFTDPQGRATAAG
jgi:uncharacterized protein (DUF342 family)